MLEIYANNKKLQLPDDISVNMTWENPMLLQDRIPAPYSLSFTLPATPANLQAFGNPQRLTSSANWGEVNSRALFNSVTFLNGKLNLQEVKKKLKLNFQGEQFPPTVRQSMRSIEMEYFNFGTGSRFSPNFTDGWSKDYLDTVFNNATTGEKFAACPVRVKDEEWPYDDFDSFGNYAATKLYLNFFNVQDGDWLMKDGVTDIHAAVFPQPYIHYLLDTVFAGVIGDNPFKTDLELKKLVMATSYHHLYSDSLMGTYRGVVLDNTYYTDDIANYFYINSFFNSYLFNDFLKNILKMFCFSFLPRIDGKWDIVHNKTILESTVVEDWNDKFAGEPSVSHDDGRKYCYGYSEESTSNETEGSGSEVNDINALLTTGVGIYRIKSTGEVYEKRLKDKKEETDPDEFVYERLKSGLAGNTDGENPYTVSCEVSPIGMCVDEYWMKNSSIPIPKANWHVAEFAGNRSEKAFAPKIGFYRGFIDKDTGVIDGGGYAGHYPFLTPFNKDLAGNSIGDYSLAWEGDDGLIERFHKEFKAYIEKDKVKLTGYFKLTELDLKNLDWRRKIFLKGKHFFLNKVETTIKKRKISLSKCELIEA